jgi:hypothetical protein
VIRFPVLGSSVSSLSHTRKMEYSKYMKDLRPVSSHYTVNERASKIYSGVLDIFDYNASSDVVTPLNLAREQVRQCNKIGTLCIPGAGIGTYVLAALLEGFRPENITAIEFDLAYFGLGSGIFSRFGVNYVHEDYLTWSPGMKFDVIIGNPPYQDASNKLKAVKLWPRFVEQSLKLLAPGGYLSFVTPSTWLTSRTGNGKKVRNALTGDFNLISVDTTAGSYFKVGVDIAQWCGRAEPYSGVTLVDGKPYDLREVYASDEERKLYEIFDKILDKSVEKLPLVYTNRHLQKSQLVKDGQYEVHFSGPSVKLTNVELTDVGVPKLVAPWSCSYKKVFHTANPTGIFNCWMPCSEEEFETYRKIWDLKVVRLLCEKYKKTCGFTPAVEYGLIPNFRGFTDADVYAKLELTVEQISLVERLVK